jgi:hypothetical protein
MDKVRAKVFLRAILEHLIIKRNLAWIVLCFLDRAVTRGASKGQRGRPRLTPAQLELRASIRDLVMKINSGKGKATQSFSRLLPEENFG